MEQYETVIGLVKQYSPTGSESSAVEWLVGRMTTLGYTRAFSDEAGNAVGLLGDGPNQLVLLGHIDTVPGEIPVRVENGILHGRGSVDAKGPLAAFVDAAAQVGAQPGWQIAVVGAVEEEGESRGAWHAVSNYRPEFAVIGEPSGWETVTLGYKGVARLRYSVEKESGHTASGETSACEEALAFWNRFMDLCRAHAPESPRKFDQITPSLRHMESCEGEFSDRATLAGNVRLPPGVSAGPLLSLAQKAAQGEGVVELEGKPLEAYRAEKTTPLVSAFLAAIRAAGGKPAFSVKLGTADLCVAGTAWKCPMAVYGPGDSALDHTPKEHLVLAEYRKAVEVLTQTLRRIMQT